LQDTSRYLSWSQLGLTQQDEGLAVTGIGQRWISGDWLLGYNTFYDNLLDENLARTGLGRRCGDSRCVFPPILSTAHRLDVSFGNAPAAYGARL
jgi:hypothetical protein